MSPTADDASTQPPSRVRAAIGRRVGRVLLRAAYDVQVLGADLVPRTGPVLLAANHSGLLDGPLVYGLTPRTSQFLVKTEMFHGLPGLLLRACGQIPVDRDRMDRQALLRALEVLRRGGAVGVFPEGTRGRGSVEAVHPGVAWLALQSGAPVVPVACLGTRRTGDAVGHVPSPRSPLAVAFAEPVLLRAPDGAPRRTATAAVASELRAVLAEHVRLTVERTGLALPSDVPERAGRAGRVGDPAREAAGPGGTPDTDVDRPREGADGSSSDTSARRADSNGTMDSSDTRDQEIPT